MEDWAACPFHRTRVTVGIRQDLEVWRQFLDQYNGISFWRSQRLLKAEFQVQLDTAGSAGFGIYYRGRWCAGTSPDEWHQAGIMRDFTFLEFFPIVRALWLWVEEWADSVVRFWCNNQVVVHIINSLMSHSERVMALVRSFTLRALKFNILIQSRHVPGIDNSLADASSHQQIQQFKD